MTVTFLGQSAGPIPQWVPQNVRNYLDHTEKGVPIRRLAQRTGVEASTVLRQIRKLEGLRDDLLVDAALTSLGEEVARPRDSQQRQNDAAPDSEVLQVLRRLTEPGAVLAVAAEMEKAVVVRDTGSGESTRTAIISTDLAQMLALKEWIHCNAPGRLSRYRITSAGRAEAQRLVAKAENAARGFAESCPDFQHSTPVKKPKRGALNVETPLATLARRRNKDGTPFLAVDLVRSGERLREDFELAQMSPGLAQNWDHFLTAGVSGTSGLGGRSGGPDAARARFEKALAELGPGLGDVVLRCCCLLEGLEATEKHMGWSSRSGKIVLRIALQRLRRHYESQGDASQMIG
ncbi:MAG: DUF6456 domain-containing protein [Rhodobacteraceae bacterium]|nr:DUF6456 domain-containing protein [Paracoccaceae bacterium]